MNRSKKKSTPKAGAERAQDEDKDKDILRVTTGSLSVPKGLKADSGGSGNRESWVVAVIVTLALGFIAFIAWTIHASQ